MTTINLINKIDSENKLIRWDNKSLGEYTNEVSDKTRALIMLSWWMDSTTLLYLYKMLWARIEWLEFFYSWKPSKEEELIGVLAGNLWVDYSKVNYPSVIGQDWSIQEFNESNSFYYSIAASYAYNRKIEYILAWQILDDWYWSETTEAGPWFYEALNLMLKEEYWQKRPQVIAPFLFLNKLQVARLWKSLWVDFSMTRSCTEDSESECGKCEQCIDKKKVLELL